MIYNISRNNDYIHNLFKEYWYLYNDDNNIVPQSEIINVDEPFLNKNLLHLIKFSDGSNITMVPYINSITRYGNITGNNLLIPLKPPTMDYNE